MTSWFRSTRAIPSGSVRFGDDSGAATGIGHYNQLVAEALVPHLLVILLLPPKLVDSVEHTAEQLVLRRCAYWVTMTGMEAAPEGQQSKTVHLPKSQPFSPDALLGILEKVSRGERL